jgi:hypothetical protein
MRPFVFTGYDALVDALNSLQSKMGQVPAAAGSARAFVR